ncbi:Crp/Fnr family transcriptional regulator [Methylobacterium sp. CM6247]
MLIRKLESIAPLSEEEREAIRSLPTKIRTLQAGETIVREGDTLSQCCLIVEGWACRFKIFGDGRRQIFSFHIPGDIPDLQSLHLHTMDHSLATITEATVALIPHESMLGLTMRFPRVGALLWRDTLIDAAVFREWMAGIGRKSAFGRVAHLFCELYVKLEAVGLAGDHRCPLPITQAELGDALGLTTVHVNRTLQAMRGQGLITLRGSTLVVHAWKELTRSSEFDPTYLHLTKTG